MKSKIDIVELNETDGLRLCKTTKVGKRGFIFNLTLENGIKMLYHSI